MQFNKLLGGLISIANISGIVGGLVDYKFDLVSAYIIVLVQIPQLRPPFLRREGQVRHLNMDWCCV